jgi:hypothetical protein
VGVSGEGEGDEEAARRTAARACAWSPA